MPADVPDPPIRPEVVVGRVAVGRYVLVLGDPAGTAIVAADGQDEPRPLAQAIAQARSEREPAPTRAASLESSVEDASQATSKAERAVRLFTEIAQGRLDPAAISDEVHALVGLLRRLDRDERWAEALRVARSLAMLLALLGRWVELLRSLQVAVSAAEQFGDAGGEGWALHELGTLHLAADKHADADRLLSKAHDLRERIGDRQGLEMTDRNLQILCRALRARLHGPPRRGALQQILPRPVPALIFGILLLIVGGAAGAAIRGATTGQGTRTVVVHAKSISESIKPHRGLSFQLGPHPPTVTTGDAFAVSQTATTLAASVNPNGGKVSECKLEYGTSSSYGSSVNCSPSPGSASSPVAVSASITGLATDTTYHYRVTATNPAGTSNGSDQTFTALANAPPITPPSAPSEVTAEGGNSQASVSWSAPSSTGGRTITSYTVTPYAAPADAGEGPLTPFKVPPTPTSTTVNELTNGVTYTFTVTATNAAGTGPASEHSKPVTPYNPSEG